MKLYTILVVDNSKNSRENVNYVLKDKYNLLYAQNCAEAIKDVNSNFLIHCILLDLSMPKMDGYKFLHLLRQTKLKNYVPVIILTDKPRKYNEKNTLLLDACDYIEKPFDPDVLKIKIYNAIIKNDIEHKEIKYLNAFDSLTNIYNKKHFFKVSKEMFTLFPNENFAFIRLDINKFKFINAIFGVKNGDMVLHYIASILVDYLNGFKHITYGRIESDKFGICMSYSSENRYEIIDVCNKLSEKITNINVKFNLKACLGIYFIEDNSIEMQTIFDKASIAALSIKDTYGKNFGIYTNDMEKRLLENQKIENDMKWALYNHQFKVNFQPKYDLKTGRLIGSEALTRWQHPEKGIIYPDIFIPIFENCGFIVNLDIYIFEEVCKFLRNCIDSNITVLPVSVNFSRVDIYNPKLLYTLTTIKNKYNIPSEFLHMEITETVYTENTSKIIEILAGFRERGFKIEMDDFGKGYSSLNMLSELPVDILKIDMEFLQKNIKNKKNIKILDYIIKLAKSLNLSVVAEGIETVDDLEFLKSIGCEFGQGFYFARPMSKESFRNKLLMEYNF